MKLLKVTSSQEHMATHSGNKTYTSGQCTVVLSKVSNLQYRQTQTEESLYSCKVCGATFLHQSKFKKHMRKHTGEKPFN